MNDPRVNADPTRHVFKYVVYAPWYERGFRDKQKAIAYAEALGRPATVQAWYDSVGTQIAIVYRVQGVTA